MKFCSIIIPYKNFKKTINKCLASALNQKGNVDYEILLVDDFSNDGSSEIIKKIIKKKNNYKLIRSKNKTLGPGHARNLALKKAKGKYIYFLDSDDILKNNALKKLEKEINKYKNVDLLCNNFQILDQIGNFKKNFRHDLKFYNQSKKKIIKNFFYLSIIPQVISNLIKKNLIKKNKINFSHGYFEDVFFYFRVLFYAKSIKKITSKIYIKINRKKSIVNSLTDDHIKNSFGAYHKCYKFLISSKNTLFRKKELKFLFMVSIVGQVAVFLKRIHFFEKDLKKLKLLLNITRKLYFSYKKKININYKFSSKKDIIAKNFLYSYKD